MNITCRLYMVFFALHVCVVNAALVFEDQFYDLNNWTLISGTNPATIEGSSSNPGSSRMINILDYGAVGDGSSHKLSTIFGSQAEIDAQYGPGKYTLDDEADFVGICEALARAKQEANEQLPEGAYGLWTVYMPAGVYRVNRTIDLSRAYGLTMYGAGHGATRIVFNSPSDLFYIESAGHMAFRGFTVESAPASQSTGFHFHNTIGQGGPTFKFLFDNVGFTGFYRAILATGNTMCCEMAFLKCRFLNCLTGLDLQNVQAMNFNFFGCDFEAHSDDSYFAPYTCRDAVFIKAEAGGCVNVFGGSILLHGTTLLLAPNEEFSTNPINICTGMYNFYGMTWEQWSPGKPLLFDKKGDVPTRAKINFDNCRFYQRVAARGADLGVLKNGMNVTIRNSHCNFGKIQLYIDDNTRDQWGSLTVENSKFIDYYEVRSEEAKQFPNLTHHVRYMHSVLRPSDHAAFDGKPKFNQMDFDIRPDATVSGRLKRIDYSEPAGTLKGNDGQIVLRIPRHGILRKIGVVKTSSEQAAYLITDSSGSVQFGRITTDAATKKGFIDNIEMLNDGNNWDGSIKIQIQTGGGTGYIFCEYF